MALSIKYPDKILAGLNQSYTASSTSGTPSGKVIADGKELPHRVIHLGEHKNAKPDTAPEVKYKISFLLPADSAGKTLEMKFQAGGVQVDDSKDITAE